MQKKATVLLALISISLIATAGIGAVSASDEPVVSATVSKINLEGHAPVGAIYYGPDAMDHGIPGHAPAGGFIYYGPDTMDHGIPGHAPAVRGFIYYDRIPGHAPAGGFIYYGPDAMDHGIPGHALP